MLNAPSKYLVYLCLLMFNPWAMAKNNDHYQQNSLTLSSAIKRTLTQHPSLKVFEFRQASLAGQQQTQNLKSGYEVGFEVENFGGSGDLTMVENAEFTVSLSSIIEMGDKREARVGVVNNQKLLLEAERKIATLNILGEVTRRYIAILAAQERVALAKEATQLAQETLLEVEKRAKAGAAPEAEIKRAMAAVGNARLTASSEQQRFTHAKLALALMWNETSASFDRVDGKLLQFSADVAFNQLFAKVKQNPVILAFATEARLKAAQLRLAQTQSSADIKWSVGLRQVQEVNDTAFTAGFSIPLFAPKRNAGAVISAQSARDGVGARREATLLKLRTQLYHAFSNRKQAIFTANSLKDRIIPLLEDALNETQTAYQRGLYSYLDFLTARQELLFARRAMIDAAAAALRYGADIEQLIAAPLPASQHNLTLDFQGITQ